MTPGGNQGRQAGRSCQEGQVLAQFGLLSNDGPKDFSDDQDEQHERQQLKEAGKGDSGIRNEPQEDDNEDEKLKHKRS